MKLKVGSPEYNAFAFRDMIDGNNKPYQKIVEINAGAAIYLAGKCKRFKRWF